MFSILFRESFSFLCSFEEFCVFQFVTGGSGGEILFVGFCFLLLDSWKLLLLDFDPGFVTCYSCYLLKFSSFLGQSESFLFPSEWLSM